MKKNALITGVTGGIGQAICQSLKDKFNLILVARNEGMLDEVLKENKSVIKRIKCDLANFNQIREMIEEINKIELDVDVLVNNAGITDDSLFIRMGYEKWENVININLNANFLLTSLISKQMIKKKWGRIINITSVVGHVGNMGQANYAASKAGLVGMTKSVAQELAKWNITANCISPGFIKSNMTDSLTNEQKDIIKKKIPVGEIGSPDDVANCVEYLASNASSYMTGETIHINGGMAML